MLVLLSGGSFRALKMMNSNLFGLPLFSAGLSTLQLRQFQSHHVLATVFAENVPQIALQYYFMFELGLPTITAIASFSSSIFNILLSVMTVIVFRILNRNQRETPFTILVSWKEKDSVADQGIERVPTLMAEEKKDLDPYYRCGRRKALAKLLGQITRDQGDAEAVKFEIMASVKKDGGCLLHGVYITDNSVAVAVRRETMSARRESLSRSHSVSMSMNMASPMTEFMTQRNQIEKAVFTAFKLDQQFRDLYVFKVTVSEIAQTTRDEKVKLILNGLKDLKVSRKTMAAVKDEISGVDEDDVEESELHGLLRNVSENELIDGSDDEFAGRRGSIV